MMRRPVTYSILFALCAIVTSCGLCGHLPTEVHVRDSTVVSYVDSTIVSIRDSVVLVPVPAESSSAVLPDRFRSHVETSIAESDAWVADGLLHHTIKNRSGATLPAVVPVVTTAKVIRSDNEYTGLTDRVVVKEVEKKLSWWQRFRIGAFWWLVAIALVGWRREILSLIKKII